MRSPSGGRLRIELSITASRIILILGAALVVFLHQLGRVVIWETCGGLVSGI
jgi:hypothetical protein